MVGAALGEGLDWITLTDHSLGPDNTHAKRAYEEAREAAKDTGLLVMPGEEFTAGNRYHANVINGMIELTREASLEEVVDAVLAKDTDQHPITVKWNHPGNGEGVPESHLKRLPLLELRMGDLGKSDAIQLWGKLLNEGIRVFAESSSDSHSVSTNRLGVSSYLCLPGRGTPHGRQCRPGPQGGAEFCQPRSPGLPEGAGRTPGKDFAVFLS